MPTYTYSCECGCSFVQTRSIKEDVSTSVCHQCGKVANQIISGGATIMFVGSNWAGKEAKLDADSRKISQEGGEYVNNPDYWAEED